jgi:hypothetical protein
MDKITSKTTTTTESIPAGSNNRPLVSFDWAIKRLLRDKTNFEVIEGFLSELLGKSIRITNILESESNKEHAADKYNRVDITAESVDVTEEGDVTKETAKPEIMLIELQFMAEIDYLQRMLYGVSKAAVERIAEKDEYSIIRKIYSINIVYFDLGRGDDYVYHGKTDFKGLHKNDTLKLSERQQKVFSKEEAGDLFPEYYILKINNFNDTATTPLDEWIYFLKNDSVKEGFGAKGLLKASEILDYSSLSKEEKSEYDYLREQKSRFRSQVFTAKDEGIYETEKKYEKIVEEKDKVIEEMKKALEEERKIREEKEKAFEEELEKLKRMYNNKHME